MEVGRLGRDTGGKEEKERAERKQWTLPHQTRKRNSTQHEQNYNII